MELKSLKCPVCGASVDVNKIDFTRKIAKCSSCDETFVIEQAENFAKVEVDKSKDIKNYRTNLSIAVEKNNVKEIKRLAENILDILPDDYEGGYFYAYALSKLGDSSYLYDFYKDTEKVYTEESATRVAEHVIANGDLRDNKFIEEYLRHLQYSAGKYISYYKEIFLVKFQTEELYDDIARDVFICHRSIDCKVAEKIVKTLEDDGNKCWISSRNLRPNDNENYWDNIKRAIKSCRVFLVVSSWDAMLSTDVKKEMAYAKDLNKRRLEVKIDDSEHTAFFKDFFDGCKWIKGENYNDIKKRVAELIFPELSDCTERIENKVILSSNEQVKYSEGLEIVDGVLRGLGTCTAKEITIPNGVSEIGDGAFVNIEYYHDAPPEIIGSDITSVYIPDTVKAIGSMAFCNCHNLTKIDIPNSVIQFGEAQDLWEDGDKFGVFYGCANLEEIQIGSGIKKIPSGTFEGCVNLKKITYYEGTHIEYYANFKHDFDIDFDNPYYNYDNDYPKIKIVNFIGSIEGWLKEPLIKLNSDYDEPFQLLLNGEIVKELLISTDIPCGAFENFRQLEKVVVGKDVNKIEPFAFFTCDNLRRVEFSDTDNSVWQLFKDNNDNKSLFDTINTNEFTIEQMTDYFKKHYDCTWIKIYKNKKTRYKLCPICKTKFIKENEETCWACKNIHQRPKDSNIPVISSHNRDKYDIDEAEQDYWFDVGDDNEKTDNGYLDDIQDDE